MTKVEPYLRSALVWACPTQTKITQSGPTVFPSHEVGDEVNNNVIHTCYTIVIHTLDFN